MSNMGSSGVANFALTSIGQAVRTMAVVGVGGNDVDVEGPSAAFNFMPVFGTTNPQLDPRITFSRASNATVVGSDGLIQYAPHNLVTFSEQFDNAAWTKIASTITANATTAPNGTITADKLVENTAGGTGHYVAPTSGVVVSVGVTYTYSAYAKAAERTFFQLIVTGVGSAGANLIAGFDLSNGTAGTPSSGSTSSITNVGSGWYRCSITVPVVTLASPSVQLRLAQNSTAVASSYTGDGVSGAFIWGAQWEVTSAPTTYNPTTVKNLLGYSEAFDNAAWTKSNSFIQTNLLLQSEAFDSASWSKAATVVTTNAAVAPNGATTADKLIANTVSGVHYAAQVFTAADNTTYTFSFYAKASEYNQAQLNTRNKAGSFRSVIVSLVDGTNVTSPAAGLTIVTTDAGNGWFRISGSFDSGTGATTPSVYIYPASGGTANFVGNDVDGIFVWGAQVVQGSVAGDYQQTTSAALPVGYQDPNGTMTADKFVENAGASLSPSVIQSVSVISGTSYTFSCYAKEDALSAKRYLMLLLSSTFFGANIRVVVNLATGVATGINSPVSVSSTSVGNGWYRISITAVATSSGSSSFQLRLTNDAGGSLTAYTGDGTSGIYIWGAQLSDSASLDQYVNSPVAAPSSTAYYGPRFDYNPSTLAPLGLLIEEQRVNLALQSEGFDNTSIWTATNITVSANTSDTTAPSGTSTAEKFTDNATNGAHRVSTTPSSFLGATTYAASVFAKAGTHSFVQLLMRDGANADRWFSIVADLSTGAITQTGAGASATLASSSIVAFGNGWYRIQMTGSVTAVGTAQFQVCFAGAATGNTFSGFGTLSYAGTGTTLYAWGAQLEAGAFATSYIPTTTAQVTRSADVALVQGSNFSSWYNPNEGTLTGQYTKTTAQTTDVCYVRVDNSGDSNRVQLSTGAAFVVYNPFIITENVSQGNSVVSATQTGTHRFGYAFGFNSLTGAFDGVLGATDNTVNMPNAINRMCIGNSNAIAQFINGHIEQISYYPTRLTTAQLQALTV